MKIGIIGAGHLGKALAVGLIQSGMKQEQIILNARSKETLEAQKQKYPGMEITTDKKELAAKADVIVLVVKALNAGEVLAEIGETDLNGKTVISLMAGVTLADMRQMLKDSRGEYRLLRMMPTVGISICKGVTGVSWENGQTISEEVMDLFRPLGYLIPLPEEKLESITITAASGLAFTATLMKAYRDSCTRLTGDTAISEAITLRVFENVIETVRNGDTTFEQLIEQICTKGGTTEAGMSVLENSDLNEILNQTLDTAYARVSGLKEK